VQLHNYSKLRKSSGTSLLLSIIIITINMAIIMIIITIIVIVTLLLLLLAYHLCCKECNLLWCIWMFLNLWLHILQSIWRVTALQSFNQNHTCCDTSYWARWLSLIPLLSQYICLLQYLLQLWHKNGHHP
jgi:hypothetical protein